MKCIDITYRMAQKNYSFTGGGRAVKLKSINLYNIKIR